MANLTIKQQVFVDEYLVDLNATQAAIRAGYSPKFANTNANKLLQNTTIKNELSKAMAERSKRTGINQDRIIYELARIALLNPTDVINMDEATIRGDANRDDTAAISSVKVKIIPTLDGNIVEREVKTYDKLKALELLGKHQGMWKDNININAEVAVQIVDDINDSS